MSEPLQYILIIGASSAVAQACINRWHKPETRFYLLARNPEKIRSLQQQLGDHCIGHQCFDFNARRPMSLALQKLKQDVPRLDRVLLAQGVLSPQLSCEQDMDALRQCFDDNLFNPLAFIQELLAFMQHSGGGQLIAISSVAGDRGRPRNFAYGAAKGALNLYLQGVRSVYHHTDVLIYTIKLGPVISPMTETHEKNFSFSTTEQVAEKITACLQHKPGEYYVPGWWRWVMLIVRNLPESLFQKLGFLSNR